MQVKKDIIELMVIEKNTDLRLFSTMRLGGRSKYSARIKDKNDLIRAVNFAKENDLPIICIGKGSNVIWKEEGFNGLLIINEIGGIKFDDMGEYVLATSGSGEIWDELVEKAVDLNLSGIESLALIPGTTGATPIQNVGAYGQEVSDTISEIEMFDLQNGEFIIMKPTECEFGYRTSRFKKQDKNRFIITSVSFKLSKDYPNLPLYPAVQHYLEDNNIKVISPAVVRKAVIAIRSSKLPDPAEIANNGSFFSNPIIDRSKFIELQKKFEDIVYWQTAEGKYKLSAAWLMDQAGFSNFEDKETGMSTWPTQSLVIINRSATATNDLIAFRNKILDKIEALFGIRLEQEPELLP